MAETFTHTSTSAIILLSPSDCGTSLDRKPGPGRKSSPLVSVNTLAASPNPATSPLKAATHLRTLPSAPPGATKARKSAFRDRSARVSSGSYGRPKHQSRLTENVSRRRRRSRPPAIRDWWVRLSRSVERRQAARSVARADRRSSGNRRVRSSSCLGAGKALGS